VTLVAEVLAPDRVGPLLFVNHVPSWQPAFEHERELPAVLAGRLLEELAGPRHVVLAGDLDAAPDAASVRFWSGRQALGSVSVCYRDAWERIHPGEPGAAPTTAAPPWTSSPARASSISRSTACGPATTSASPPT
jgi:hypothetical protein